MTQIKWANTNEATAAAAPVAKNDLIAFQISPTKYRIGKVIGNTRKVLTLDSGGEHYEIDPADYEDIAFPISLSYMKPQQQLSAMKLEYTQAKLRKLQNPEGDVRTKTGPRVPKLKDPVAEDLTPDQVYTAIKAYKGVIAEKITQMPDGALHVTLAHAGTSMASAMFTLRGHGSHFYRVVNAEVSAIPFGDPVGSGRWTKVRTQGEDSLANVLRPVIVALQKKAQQKVKSSLHSGGGLKTALNTIAALPPAAKQQQPTSAKAIQQAIKELETQRDAAVKGFNDKINALRDSLADLSSMPSGPSGSTKKGTIYGTSDKGSVATAAYKKVFGGSFKPVVGKEYAVKVGSESYILVVNHLISNNTMLLEMVPKRSIYGETFLVVKGEGIWRDNDANLPAQYRKYL